MHFNALCSKDEQDSYLAGQICLMSVARHRVRKPDGVQNTSSCKYFVRVDDKDIGSFQEHFVCYNAFLSIHGITAG